MLKIADYSRNLELPIQVCYYLPVAGKVFPKLRRRTSQTNGQPTSVASSSRSSGDEADIIEIGDTGETVEDADMAADYVFRIINVQQPTVTQGQLNVFWCNFV